MRDLMPERIIYDEGRPVHNVARLMEDVKAAAGPYHYWDARVALKLLAQTKAARSKVHRAVVRAKMQDTFGQKKRLIRELRELGERLDRYAEALGKVKPNDRIPGEVAPLVRKMPGAGHFTPDYLTPFTIENQTAVLERDLEQTQTLLQRFMEEAVRLPSRVVDTATEAASAVAEEFRKGGELLKWALLGALGLGVVGIAVYAYVGTRKG